jgi:hypothetical protein
MPVMANAGTPSFEKFNYLLRPSKQVERKLFIEALHRLAAGGLPLREYTYLGMGSVYYADFILFHKYLYLDNMICVEGEPIPKRMDFNKPFDFIRLEMKRVAEIIPDLDRALKHIVWLDYEDHLSKEILADTAGLLHILAPGSVLVVTVDADPRLLEDPKAEDQCTERQARNLLDLFQSDLGRYHVGEIPRSMISRTGLPKLFAQILQSQFKEELAKRPPLRFQQLFNFRYADGAQMLTLGGIISSPSDLATVNISGVLDLPFVTTSDEPIKISVPPLTIREKQWLDKRMSEPLKSEDLAFELEKEPLDNFRAYYRYYPTYYETLI